MSSENGESIQILHYENGQKYEPHFDFFHDVANQQMGGHRIATVLMYLSNVEKGGETIFPNSEVKSSIVFFGQKKKKSSIVSILLWSVAFNKCFHSLQTKEEKENWDVNLFALCRKSCRSPRMIVGLNVHTEDMQVVFANYDTVCHFNLK